MTNFKSIISVLAITSLVGFMGCSKGPVSVNEDFSGATSAALFKIAAAPNTPFAKIADSASLVISASDMNNFVRALTITDSTVQGTITGIPSGKNRLFTVTVFDSLDSIQYQGSAKADLPRGATVNVSITLYRAGANAIINGSIVDSVASFQYNDFAIATSTGGFGARRFHSSVAYNNKLWVIGGTTDGTANATKNDVWSSVDGVTWLQVKDTAAFPKRLQHACVVFNNKMWVIGGNNGTIPLNDVWYSVDGATWTQATGAAAFAARYAHSLTVFNGKMWVIGGTKVTATAGVWIASNDVWSSSDGVTWTEATSAAAFSARSVHGSVAFNNKIWVIAGGTSSGVLRDVWSSSDGVTWVLATASAAFPARYSHGSVVLGSKMWVFGGDEWGFTYANDIWYSDDGSVWKQASAAAAFSARAYFSSAILDNKIWIIGGGTGSTGKSDVWYSK